MFSYQEKYPNIIIFGEPSVGKSSIINMLSESAIACTSSICLNPDHRNNDGVPVPLYCRSQSHVVSIDEQLFRLHEATAFSPDGGIPETLDIVQAYTLIQQLEFGVSLLVFCMHAPRITNGAIRNWNLFYEIFCQAEVPVVAVITGLENEADMDAWYPNNKSYFHRLGMYPKSAACITTIKGKLDQFGKHIFQQEFDESVKKVRHLIRSSYLTTPWVMERVEWFNHYVPRVVDVKILWWTITRYVVKKKKRGAVHDLVNRCGMRKADAMELAGILQSLAKDSQ